MCLGVWVCVCMVFSPRPRSSYNSIKFDMSEKLLLLASHGTEHKYRIQIAFGVAARSTFRAEIALPNILETVSA